MALRDPYARNSFLTSSYPYRTEIDLRQELEDMLDGIYPEIAKAQNYLLRKFRRNNLLERIACECMDTLTQEPDKDTYCPGCQGEGYLWDESFIQIYRKSLIGTRRGPMLDKMIDGGIMNVGLYSFWFKSSIDVTKQDKIVKMAINAEGKFVQPLRREELYRIGTLLDLRSDNGRLEFWQAFAYAEKRTFLNGPTRRHEDK